MQTNSKQRFPCNSRHCYGPLSGKSEQLSALFHQRILVEDTYESPFDSYYSPAQGGPLHSPWFPMSSSPAGNSSSGSWAYYVVEVPRGAAGAVLSLKLRHATSVTAELYARLEGFPTLHHWDVRAKNLKVEINPGAGRSSHLETQKQLAHSGKSTEVSLHMVYPVEGVWCVGIHYLSSAVSSLSISAEESIPPHLEFFDRISFKLKKLWDDCERFVGRLYQTIRVAVDKSSPVKHQTVTGVETSILGGSELCKGVCSEQRVASVGGPYDGIKTVALPEERSSMVDNLDLIPQTQKPEVEDGLVEEPLAARWVFLVIEGRIGLRGCFPSSPQISPQESNFRGLLQASCL